MTYLCYGYNNSRYTVLDRGSLKDIDFITTKCDRETDIFFKYNETIDKYKNKNYGYIMGKLSVGIMPSIFIMNDEDSKIRIRKGDLSILYKKDEEKLDSKKVLERNLKLLRNSKDRVKTIKNFYNKFERLLEPDSFIIGEYGDELLEYAANPKNFNKLISNVRKQLNVRLNKDGSYSDLYYTYIRMIDEYFKRLGFDNSIAISSKLKDGVLKKNSFSGEIDENLDLDVIQVESEREKEKRRIKENIESQNEIDDFYVEEDDDERTWKKTY